MANNEKRITVLGATGYVGGRLVPRLLEAGYTVRAVSRSVRKLEGRPWAGHPNVELVAADVGDKGSLEKAMADTRVVYYLVHSMNPSEKDFAKKDRESAFLTATCAEAAGVERIIYLSGLGEASPTLSKHLQSRTEVGEILSGGKVPTTIFRAAMIIGSGSASFEILRYLVERLPIMVTPRWVETPCQPIAIRNVLNYLIGALEHPETAGKTYDIGGQDVMTYRSLMEIYAEEAHLNKRWVIPVPVFSPKLSSYWIHLVTPVPAAIARPLAEGLKNPVVCRNNKIRGIVPQELLSAREAIRLALENTQTSEIETHWTDAGVLPPVEAVYPGDPNWSGGSVYRDQREILLEGEGTALWMQLRRIGGKTGWYYGNWLWRLRGLLDILFGGVGHRRGRRDPQDIIQGDALDFWRVLDIQPERKLTLLAEMKLPGRAVLSFEMKSEEAGPQGRKLIRLFQTAWFVPRGLGGVLYWYAVSPLHHKVFNGMLRGLAKSSGMKILNGPSQVHSQGASQRD